HRILEGLAERLPRVLDDLQGVASDECADAGADDDDEFVGLPQHGDIAALGHEGADDTTENDDQSNNDIHAAPPQPTLNYCCRNTFPALREPVRRPADQVFAAKASHKRMKADCASCQWARACRRLARSIDAKSRSMTGRRR